MKKIILSLLVALTLTLSAQIPVPNNWQTTGNAVNSNTASIGTTNNRSFYIKTNNLIRLKVDSIGGFLFKRDAGVVADTIKNIHIRDWPTASGFSALYGGNVTATGTAYFWLPTGNDNILNAQRALLFNTGHRRFMSAQSTLTNTGAIVTLDAITNTISVANAALRHLTVGGSVTTWTPGTTTLNQDVLISAHTHSALTTATITNDVGLEVNAPTAGTGMTQTNVWAISCKGSQNILNRLSIGSSLLAPAALLHFAAPATGTPCMKFTSHTIPSLNAGEFDYNSTSGFHLQGSLNVSGPNFLLGTTTSFGSGMGALTVATNTTAAREIVIYNSSSSNGAFAGIRASNNATSGSGSETTIGVNGSGSTGGGAFGTANLGYLYNQHAAGLAILAYNANGKIFFYTGGFATEQWRISSSGKFSNTGSDGTAYFHLKAGTATASTAPLKFTSGTVNTTAETGAMEYNGTNLFFTRTGTTRESVITVNAVNAVSPTGQNRTLTVVIDGTTYYITAKTTND